MTPKQQFHGAACKTCRRRGRKCTRQLPKCRTCTDKGIECEGYTLKWVGLASRGRLAGDETILSKSNDTTPRLESTTDIDDVVTLPARRRKRKNSLTTVANGRSHQRPELELGPNQADAIGLDQACIEDVDQREVFAASAVNMRQDYSRCQPMNLGLDLSDDAIDEDFTTQSTKSNAWKSQVLEPGPRQTFSHANIEMTVAAQPPVATLDINLMANLWNVYNIPTELRYILDYHVTDVAPRLCVDHATMRNPYSAYILPMAIEKPVLLYACAALAASHFDGRLYTPNMRIESLRFRGKAMRRLQEQLWSEQSAKDEGNLAAVLMLVLTDICLGGFSNFDTHFAAAKNLVDLRGNEHRDGTFVEQYLGWLDIMSATCSKRAPMFKCLDVLSWGSTFTEWNYDVIPCPPDQFAILAELVDLHKSSPDLNEPQVEISVNEIKKRLFSLPTHVERDEHWLHLTEAYRAAIALFALRLFCLQADEDELLWLTQSVFYHVRATPASTGWADHQLWPLFQAGLEIKDTRRRRWIKERAKLMQGSGGFRNVETAMNILDRVWTDGGTPETLSSLCSNGLEIFVPV